MCRLPCRCGLSHSLDDEDVVQVLKSKTAAAEDGAWKSCSVWVCAQCSFYGHAIEASCCCPRYVTSALLSAHTGRGRFKSQASGPARIADREKKAPLKT